MGHGDARTEGKQERATRRINQRFWRLAALSLFLLFILPILFWLFERGRREATSLQRGHAPSPL